MYNDEFPNGTSSETAAHAKGVIVFDGVSGFWLVHSVPRFPPSPDEGNYTFPTTGLRYGQTMLCLSLPFNQADIIGEFPVYFFFFHVVKNLLISPSSFKIVYPDFVSISLFCSLIIIICHTR